MATSAFSGPITGERTSTGQWIGLITAFTGVALTIFARMDFSDSQAAAAYLIPFISVAAMTFSNLLERKMEKYQRWRILPMDQTLFYQSLATFLVFMIPAFLIGRSKNPMGTSIYTNHRMAYIGRIAGSLCQHVEIA